MKVRKEDLKPGALVQCEVCPEHEILLLIKRGEDRDGWTEWRCLQDDGSIEHESEIALIEDFVLLSPAPDLAATRSTQPLIQSSTVSDER